MMDRYGYYVIVRFRDVTRGEALNIGVIVFWQFGWAAEFPQHAFDRLARARPDLDMAWFQQEVENIPNGIGMKAPGEFNPYMAYFLLHQYRQEMRRQAPLGFSTLRAVTVAYDGIVGYEGGVAEAAKDLASRYIYQEAEDIYAE